MRKKRPIARTEGLTRDASLVVIASEDRYAVKQYFDRFRSTRIQFRVLETERGQSSPQHVQQRLQAYMREYDFGEGDQFWLVCDTDHWIESNHISNLVAVVRWCRQQGIGVALSNPCFDLWLLLHVDRFPTESNLTCEEVGNKIRAVVGQYNKTKVYNLPITDQGVRRAIGASKAHQPTAGDIPSEPQTAVHLIIDALIARNVISVRT
ncbi:MAG: RloB domain-containing protein [Planctomycetales bacterium]|nr:RloB domain-containing protein [Planctomycetales bacterium]